MLYIITDTLLNSGIFTWNKRFSEILEKCNYKYLFISKNDIINKKYTIKNSIIIFNNVKSSKIMNDKTLYKLSNLNKLYFVIHGDICPINKLFIQYEHYFYGVISISKKIYSLIIKNFIDKHVVYIPNKIYLPIKKKKELNLKNINFGFVGRLSREKNIPLIFYSIKKYIEYISDTEFNRSCTLHLFGISSNKNYENYLKKLAEKLDIRNKVIFHGNIDKLDDIYNKIDILLLSSISEGIPYCLIEASYYNIPCVVTNVGCINEIIQDNRYLVNLYNYPTINNLYIKNYSLLLLDIGYIAFGKKDNIYITDNKNHTCKLEFNYYNDIISSLDIYIDNNDCNVCKNIFKKQLIFKENVNLFTENIIKCVNNYDNIKIEPIYENIKIEENIRMLVEDEVIDIDYNLKTYNLNTPKLIINLNEYYGIYYSLSLDNIYYKLHITYKISKKCNCYLFIIDNNDYNLYKKLYCSDYIISTIIPIKLITKNIKIGIRFSDNDVNGEISLIKFILESNKTINLLEKKQYNINRYNFKILDKSRYENYKYLDNILFVFLGCKNSKYSDRYKNLIDYVKKFNFNYLILIGDSSKVFYDDETKVLHLDVKDIYENLSKKIYIGFKWIYENLNYEYIYKCDDDFSVNILNYIPKNYKNYNYYGNFIVRTLDKKWHMGKCKNNELNCKKYDGDLKYPYAGGGFGYLLNRKSIKTIIKSKSEIYNEIYEDKAIGDILYKNKIFINKKNLQKKIKLYPYKTYIIFDTNKYIYIHTSKDKFLIYIIVNNKLLYQDIIQELEYLYIYKETIEIQNKILFNIIIQNIIVNEYQLEEISLDNFIIENEETNEMIKQYNISSTFESNDIQIILKDRVFFDKLYIYKWIYHKCNFNTSNIEYTDKSELIKNAKIEKINIDDINSYDIVYY